MNTVSKDGLFVAVDYPGVVVNDNKMVQTLGGEKEISKVYNDSQKRLELRYRSDDPFCKCAHGDRFNTTNLLMKVIRRTRKQTNENGVTETSVEYVVECLGAVPVTYKFKAKMDFQILPMEVKGDQGNVSLLPQLLPTELHDSSWLSGTAPYFILPLLYTRFDVPHQAFFKREVLHRDPEKTQRNRLPPSIIGRTRQRRAGYAVFVNFDDKVVPKGPVKEAVSQLKTHPPEPQLLENLKKAFEERPIWSRVSLSHKLKCEKTRTKYALPTVAYHFSNGPWRTFWAKFGYDPRKDPSSKIYQLLDFRIGGLSPEDDSIVKSQRGTHYTLPTKLCQSQPRAATINTDELMAQDNEANREFGKDNDTVPDHEFHSGHMPAHRQCFYQMCDVFLDEVQKLVHANDGREKTCLERDGWFEPGILDKCRDLIAEDIKQTIVKLKAEKSCMLVLIYLFLYTLITQLNTSFVMHLTTKSYETKCLQEMCCEFEIKNGGYVL